MKSNRLLAREREHRALRGTQQLHQAREGIARVAQACAPLRDSGAPLRQAASNSTEPPVPGRTEGSSTFNRVGRSQWSPQA